MIGYVADIEDLTCTNSDFRPVLYTGNKRGQLYTLYGPPNHPDRLDQRTKAEAVASNQHFDGKTTE